MRKPKSVSTLTEFGRVRLSKSFYMRDFLYSEIAAINGFVNIPDDPDLAIAAGARLCETLLEPLQETFGRLAIRSAYRSPEVNGFGNAHGLDCASNDSNRAAHIWDQRDENKNMGATACVIVPSFARRFSEAGDWQRLAWWIHDHLPYASLYFFKFDWAFNISWHERPVRRIDSYVLPVGCLTKPGMANHTGSHEDSWRGIAG